jgi:hypothetical protein
MKTENELLSWISFTGIEIIITSGTGGLMEAYYYAIILPWLSVNGSLSYLLRGQ